MLLKKFMTRPVKDGLLKTEVTKELLIRLTETYSYQFLSNSEVNLIMFAFEIVRK